MGCEKRPKRPRHHPACSVERQGPADKCVGGQRIQKLKSKCVHHSKTGQSTNGGYIALNINGQRFEN
jgi:hypothetical protein